MEPNTTGTVALGSGIAVIVLQIVMFCAGLIPIVQFVNLLLLPLIIILDVVAIVTGVMGMKKAALLNGTGKGAAVAGLVIGILHILLVIGMIIIGMIFGGLALLGGALG